MKFLTHEIPASSLVLNSAFVLGFHEIISNLLTYVIVRPHDLPLSILYLALVSFLVLSMLAIYGRMTVRYRKRLEDHPASSSDAYYRLLL
jgi:membrane protein implicated in regulation of membrane protease activity